MRDFKAGGDINVGGDVHIHDASSQPKLLVMCNTGELLNERTHRKTLLSNERSRKIKYAAIFFLVCALGLGVGALWLHFSGKSALSSVLLGLGGLFVAGAAVKIVDEPSEFERRQLDALREISHILRERGVE